MNSDMDLNPLIRLKDALEGVHKNTSKMLYKLEKFETRLTTIDTKMRPMQQATEKYNVAKNNIILILQEVDKTSEYFQVAHEVKEIIELGLTAENQQEYLDAFGRLSNAKKFFETHKEIKSSGSLLANIEVLLNKALGVCVGEFEKIMQSSGKSIELVDGRYNIVHPISEADSEHLKAICTAFEINRHTAHYKVYRTVRLSKLKSELRDLEVSRADAWAEVYKDGPYEKGTHPFQEYYLLASGLLRSELQLWGSTLPTNEESLNIFISICDAVVAEIYRILTPIVSDDTSTARQRNATTLIHQSKMCLIRLDVLDSFLERYYEFRDLVRPDVRRESAASEGLTKMRIELISSCIRNIDYILSDGFSNAFEPAKKGVGFGKNSNNENLSCDLHPVTGNILHCCKELSGFSQLFKRLYEVALESNTVKISASTPQDSDTFIISLLQLLFNGLEERTIELGDMIKLKTARRTINVKQSAFFKYDDKTALPFVLSARKHLFLSNNLFAIFNYIKDKKKEVSSEHKTNNQRLKLKGHDNSSTLKSNSFSQYADKIESRLIKEQMLFCDTIATALGVSTEDMEELEAMVTRDKSKKGRVLKGKFNIFNSGMDAFQSQQGEWRVSSAALRERLSQQLVGKIYPPYEKFYTKYSGVRFSKKHLNDYLKFSPTEVERVLKTYFGRI